MEDNRTKTEDKAKLRAKYKRLRNAIPKEVAMASDKAITANFLASEIYTKADEIFTFVSIGDEIDTLSIIEKALCDGKKVFVPFTISKPSKGEGGKMKAVRICGLEDLEEKDFGLREPREDLAKRNEEMDSPVRAGARPAQVGSGHAMTRPKAEMTGVDCGSEPAMTRPEAGMTGVEAAMTRVVIIVPSLAVDKEGYRIGYGGGYYDRYLKEHQENPPVPQWNFKTVTLQRKAFVVPTIPHEPHDQPINYIITEEGTIQTKA
ncbi:MAG: hypothetical protein LBN34_09145 [Clostridiales Family XIII bacterium]|jgi:5-formyltetrahydrofolate cyclo-ligase|nr:hypothetical protein [Clostridiales Family XIII bacterium]